MLRKSIGYYLSILFIICSLHLNAQDQNADSRYALLLNSGWIIPEVSNLDIISQNPFQSFETVNGKYYRILQFYKIPEQEEKDLLISMGIGFLDYLPNKAYLVSIPQSLDINSLNNKGIRALLPVSSEMKQHNHLKTGSIPGYARRGNNRIEVQAGIYRDVSMKTVMNRLNATDFEITHINPYSKTVTLIIEENRLTDLSNIPFIQFIEPVDPPGEPENYTGRTSHRSNSINEDYAGGNKYDGTDVNVQLQDDGEIGPHIDHQGRIGAQFTTDPTGDHGDHISGTIMGAGNLDPTTKGMAPGANIYVYQYDPWNDSIVSHYTKYDIRITSSSYSNGCNAGYTLVTRDHDMEVRNLTALMHVFSAGNSNSNNCGYGAGNQWGNITGGHKVGKNVIAVANLNSNDGIAGSSSRGPAHDGRIKPDISAKGSNVYSTGIDNTYTSKSGTSMSCPGISGSLAQLYHAYKSLNGGNDPHSGLIKATILNTADDLGNPGPDFKFGWGRINNYRALRVLENNWYQSDSISQNENKSYNITVPANLAQLKVMVYWHDFEAANGATTALVNNLDFVLEDNNQTDYLPWILNHLPDATTLDDDAFRGIDSINNMEQVTLDNPGSGNYSVKINGKDIPMGPQHFFIIYEFVEKEVRVSYPNGGESVVPGETEKIRWDAEGGSGFFTLEYSLDGGSNWNSIVNNEPAGSRYYDWSVPNTVTGKALIRISQNGVSDTSNQPFSIIDVPKNLRIDTACCNSFTLSWDPVGNASGYEVSILGNKYMDSIGRTTNTWFDVMNIDADATYWVSVKALGADDAYGRRAIAIQKMPGSWNCIKTNNIGVSQIISPAPGAFPGCFSGTAIDVVVEISSSALNAVSNFPVKFQLNNGQIITETYNATLNPGQVSTYMFSSGVVFGAAGPNQFKSWTEVAGDNFDCNDTALATVEVLSGSVETLPYNEDFETFNVCGTQPNCEAEICILVNGWYNEENGRNDDIDWRVDLGGTFSGGTGPTVDHKPGTAVGKYLYTEASGDCDFKTAFMISPCFDLSNTTKPTLEFWYHMLGDAIGELSVDIYKGGQWITNAWNKSGTQGGNWNSGVVDLTAYKDDTVLVRFNGSVLNDFQGDIALDNINLYDDIPLTAGIQAPDTACVGESVIIEDKSSKLDLDYNWEFGANSSPSTSTFFGPHTVNYSSGGLKTVKLVVKDGSDADSTTVQIFIKDIPVSDYSFNINSLTVDFSNESTNSTTYFWDFDDGNNSNQKDPSHTFDTMGIYQIKLIVTNACGSDSVIREVNVGNVGIPDRDNPVSSVKIYPNPNEGIFILDIKGSAENLEWKIFDTKGELVLQKSGIRVLGSYIEEFDLKYLSNGLYLIELNYGNYIKHLKVQKH